MDEQNKTSVVYSRPVNVVLPLLSRDEKNSTGVVSNLVLNHRLLRPVADGECWQAVCATASLFCSKPRVQSKRGLSFCYLRSSK